MPLQIIPKTIRMAKEDHQLAEMVGKATAAAPGETVLFPEYGAYTVDGSKKAFAELAKTAAGKKVSIITSLNLPSRDLPHADPETNHNTLFIFSRHGDVHSPQAKITPQSFEMRHLDAAFPKMGVAPYSHLNRVTLRQNGEEFKMFFFICSDLYVLPLFAHEHLRAEGIACPANFGNGAEGAAGEVIDYAVNSGLFQQGFYANTSQEAKTGNVPLTVAVEKVFAAGGDKPIPYNKELMERIVRRSSAVYPDDEYRNFAHMLQLTRNGTFTVPRSRSREHGLKVGLGEYKKVVEL